LHLHPLSIFLFVSPLSFCSRSQALVQFLFICACPIPVCSLPPLPWFLSPLSLRLFFSKRKGTSHATQCTSHTAQCTAYIAHRTLHTKPNFYCKGGGGGAVCCLKQKF
jgi:hypothetical protein